MACSLAIRLPLLACLSFIFITRQVNTCVKNGQTVPCWPGQESCGAAFQAAPRYHLMNQNGCGENDPNGPVFDPVHGVIHHFYQDHLAANEGIGPVYGHFASKDFVHWAVLPVAIWNGLDASSDPPRTTLYDTRAIYTGSAVVVNGAGPSGSACVVQIYPGLCDTHWPDCQTGVLLAQAVPANYSDVLLLNWTKPSYNPIVQNTQRDPSSPWKETNGEWRLRTYDGQFYGAASDADLLKGRWYELGPGNSSMWPTCECPSFFPLPGPTPGFEEYYSFSKLPSHVQKLSCAGKDWWMIGSYTLEKGSRTVGSFTPTEGWEDVYPQRVIDAGSFYASKDALYPTMEGGQRRINWGWGILTPYSTQSLPRWITFNAVARQLQQAPIPELKELRGRQLSAMRGKVNATHPYHSRLPFLSLAQSETTVSFTLPDSPAILRIGFAFSERFWWMESSNFTGPEIDPVNKTVSNASACQETCRQEPRCVAWSWTARAGHCHLKSGVDGVVDVGVKEDVSGVTKDLPMVSCVVAYDPAVADSDAICGSVKDKVRLLPSEKTLEFHIFSDATFLEVFFQQGRTAMTVPVATVSLASEVIISSTVETLVEASSYAMKSIWVSEDFVRKQPRRYEAATVNELWS